MDDGWGDDDVFEDSGIFDDVNVDEGAVADVGMDAETIASSSMQNQPSQQQQFIHPSQQQHENNQWDAADSSGVPPSSSIVSTSAAHATPATDTTENEIPMSDGWGDSLDDIDVSADNPSTDIPESSGTSTNPVPIKSADVAALPAPATPTATNSITSSPHDATTSVPPVNTHDNIDAAANATPNSRGMFTFGRVAETFGAALLDSMDRGYDEDEEDQDEGDDNGYGGGCCSESSNHDNDDNRIAKNDDVTKEEEEIDDNGQQSPKFGFGGGFVMKGLSRFIEAATAPQEEEDASGWGEDDDALDFDDEDGGHDETGEQCIENGEVGVPQSLAKVDSAKEELSSRSKSALNEFATETSDTTKNVESQQLKEDTLIKDKGDLVVETESPENAKDDAGWDDIDVDLSFNDNSAADATIEGEVDGVAGNEHVKKDELLNFDNNSRRPEETNTGEKLSFEASLNTSSSLGLQPFQPLQPIDLSQPLASLSPTQSLLQPPSSADKCNAVPDTIKEFVAMTESAIDSQLKSNFWKTPVKTDLGGMEEADAAMDATLDASLGAKHATDAETQFETGLEIEAKEEDCAADDKGEWDDIEDDFDFEPGCFENETNVVPAVESIQSDQLTEVAAKLENPSSTEDTAVVSTGSKGMSLKDFVETLDAELDGLIDSPDRLNIPMPSEKHKEDSVNNSNNKTNSENANRSAPMPVDSTTNEGYDVNTTGAVDNGSYSYESNKNKSPEPVQSVRLERSVLPHQDSWYINAMEGGKGGVVYSSKKIEQEIVHKDPIITADSAFSIQGALDQISPVGMPLSEMPSFTNSSEGSKQGSLFSFNANEGNSCDGFKSSELQCTCLELIMPLPGKVDESPPEQSSGFGTKKLPDGRAVLVNYEKLLQNEAAKRIILQRSVETYERTLEKLQKRHQASLELAKEQEESKHAKDLELSAAQSEIMELKKLVTTLQNDNEKESPSSETHLFEAELAAAHGKVKELENEVEDLRGKLESNVESHVQDSVPKKSSEIITIAKESDRDDLLNQIELLQSELSQVQQTSRRLQTENDSLRHERNELNNKVRDLFSAASSSKAMFEETEKLRALTGSLQHEIQENASEIERLNNLIVESSEDQKAAVAEREHFRAELSGTKTELLNVKSSLAALEDENETLRSVRDDYDVQISELKGTVEAMSCNSEKVDKLSAEIASLTYELGMKSTECEESAAALKISQAKLDEAESKVLKLGDASKSNIKLDDAVSSLREANQALEKKVADAQSAITYFESRTSELEASLNEKNGIIQSFETQVQSLNAEVMEASHLRDELSCLRESLEGKTFECEELFKTCEELKSDLLMARESQDMFDLAQEQIVGLQAQLAAQQEENLDIQKEYDDTVKKMEEQLAKVVQENDTLKVQSGEFKMDLEQMEQDYAELSQSTSETIAKYAEEVFKLEGENLELSAALETTATKGKKDFDDGVSRTVQNEIITAELRSEVNSLKRKLEEKVLELQVVSEKYEGIRREGEVGEQHNDGSRIKDLQHELASVSEKNTALNQTIESIQRERDNYIHELEQRASFAEHRCSELDVECAKLKTLNESAREERESAEHTIENLKQNLQALNSSKAQLEDKLFEVSFETQEVASLKKERDRLIKEAHELSERVDELESLSDSAAREKYCVSAREFSLEERESLLARIGELEEALEGDPLNDIRDELTSLHEERQQLDMDNEELLVQLGLMEQSKIECEEALQNEIADLRSQVSTLEDRCNMLQNDLNESRRTTETLERNDNAEKHKAEKLQEENIELRQRLSLLEENEVSLKNKIKEHLQKISRLESEVHVTKQDTGAKEELDNLRERLGFLELKLAEKNQEASSAKEEVQNLLASRDEEILTLENNLMSMSRKMEAKNNEMGSLSCKLDSLNSQSGRSRNVGVGEPEEEKDFDDVGSVHDLLVEEVDSDDFLRSQIVVLAKALERSELQRADALERIIKERKSNAESVRLLGESVKRFYSTVSCSDSA